MKKFKSESKESTSPEDESLSGRKSETIIKCSFFEWEERGGRKERGGGIEDGCGKKDGGGGRLEQGEKKEEGGRAEGGVENEEIYGGGGDLLMIFSNNVWYDSF